MIEIIDEAERDFINGVLGEKKISGSLEDFEF